MSHPEAETRKHIQLVSKYLSMCASELLKRGYLHDASKLEEPEASVFEQYTPGLKGLTYGSPEYYKCLAEMKPAIQHHQQNNRHHPEFHGDHDPISEMNLFDLMEAVMDWLAATKRHENGNIFESIKHNQGRFAMSDQVASLLRNTVLEIRKWETLNAPNT